MERLQIENITIKYDTSNKIKLYRLYGAQNSKYSDAHLLNSLNAVTKANQRPILTFVY